MSKKKIGLLLLVVSAMALMLVPTASANHGARTYQVTITNGTDGQPMTPPLASTHKKNADVFDAGEQATFEVQQIAENGNLDAAVAERGSNSGVSDFVVAVPDPENPGPLFPGETIAFKITADGGAKYFSFVAMLVCTNDGFTGVDSVKLPKKVGDAYTAALDAYDAGTEANTENRSDLVPPCAGGAPGTGESNPNLAQMGVITHHGGITGTGSLGLFGNLDPVIRDWTDVGTITIERTN